MASRNKFLACVDKIIEKLRDNNMALCEKLNLDYEDIKGEQEDEENQDGVDNDEQTSNEDDSVGESFVDGVRDFTNATVGAAGDIVGGVKNAADRLIDATIGKPEGSGSSENFEDETANSVSDNSQTTTSTEIQTKQEEQPKDDVKKDDNGDSKNEPKGDDGNNGEKNGVNNKPKTDNSGENSENLPAKKTWLSPAALAMAGGAAAATGIAAYRLGKKRGKKIRNSKLGIQA